MKKTMFKTKNRKSVTKKLILSASFLHLLLIVFSSSAYSQAYKKGDNLINAGLGFGTYTGTVLGSSYEHGTSDAISIGAGADILHYSYYGYSYNFFYFALRGSYHLGQVLNVTGNKFDPYAGLGLGYVSYGNYISSGVFLQAHAGARYYFSPKIGGFGEVGAGAATLKLGVTFKL